MAHPGAFLPYWSVGSRGNPWRCVLALVFSLPVRVLMRFIQETKPTAPFIAFLSTGLIWDVLFSPFGATARLSALFLAVTLICLLEGDERSGESAQWQGVLGDEDFGSYDLL